MNCKIIIININMKMKMIMNRIKIYKTLNKEVKQWIML